MNKEIKCPKCGTVITIDENQYNDILSQVKNEEFNKELKVREELIKEKANQEKNALLNDLKAKEESIALEKEKSVIETRKSLDDTINNLKDQINELKRANIDIKHEDEMKLKDELAKQSDLINDLKNKITSNENEAKINLAKEVEKYKELLKLKEEQVEQYKNFKQSLSTKALGESLEVYCHNLFDKDLRPVLLSTGNTIYFDKDNDVIENSKGDFVYKETTSDGVEVLSIMFEMKNENDDTETKHKNSDFFKKLDKDRKNKNCEYAVLVSMLEADNDLYNNGIANVYEYENMYVVRPNSFTSIIMLLRNLALKNLKDKAALVEAKNANIDITNFENDLADYQNSIYKNYETASDHFKKAIDKIDATIKNLEALKSELTTSGNQLRLANNKAQDITIKKLTHNNPTMKKAFEGLKK